MKNIDTCPKCGALVVPQLVRCRKCDTYLHGTSLEARIFEFLPIESAKTNPGTALMIFGIVAYYLFMVTMTFRIDPSAVIGFSGYSLRQLGATQGLDLLRGEYWRYFTSIFAHHDLLHLAFNLSSLRAAGAVVEHVFDKKKMILLYLSAGVLSMVVSFFWYVYVRQQPAFVSAGASGAVCGLIGAALVGGKKLGPQGTEIVSEMSRWAIYMVIWGFAVAGINNAAHFGGFVVGAALAYVSPPGLTKSVATNRVLSFLLLGFIGAFLACFALMIAHLKGFPSALEKDFETKSILGIRYHQGEPWASSDQLDIFETCRAGVMAGKSDAETLKVCELNYRVLGFDSTPALLWADVAERRGNKALAAELRDLAHRIGEAP